MKVPVIVVLAERDFSTGSVLKLTAGSIIEFDIASDSELTLMIANKYVATGRAVKIGENFGLRLLQCGFDVVHEFRRISESVPDSGCQAPPARSTRRSGQGLRAAAVLGPWGGTG